MANPQPQDRYATINFLLIDNREEKEKKVGTITFGVLPAEQPDEDDQGRPIPMLRSIDYAKITWLEVNKEYHLQGYGKLLMILAIGYLLYENAQISAIELDDCSDIKPKDLSHEDIAKLTPLEKHKYGIYYKLGFRIVNTTNIETLVVSFSKSVPFPPQVANSLKCSDCESMENLLKLLVNQDKASKLVYWNEFIQKFKLKITTNATSSKENNDTILENIINVLRQTCAINLNCKRSFNNRSSNQQVTQRNSKCPRTIITRSMTAAQRAGKSSSR